MSKVMRNTFPELRDLVEAHNSTRAALVSTAVHRDAGDFTVTFATLSGTGTANENLAIAATNELMVKYLLHIKDIYGTTLVDGSIGIVHKGTWTVPTLTTATSLATAYTLANAIKADYNSHKGDTTAHDNADGGNAIAATDATTLATLQTLANEAKGDLNAHMALAMGGQSIRLIPA